MTKNNAKLRRTIVRILFNNGELSRFQVAEKLHEQGLFREVPSESSLSALISKNAQIVSVGYTKIELSNGTTVRNMLFDVDRNLIRTEEDIQLTMPFSSMSNSLKEKCERCPKCKQMRYMPDMDECLVCIRKG